MRTQREWVAPCCMRKHTDVFYMVQHSTCPEQGVNNVNNVNATAFTKGLVGQPSETVCVTGHRTQIEAFWNFFQKKFHSNPVSAIMTQTVGCRAKQSGPDSPSNVRMLPPLHQTAPGSHHQAPGARNARSSFLIPRRPRISEHSHAYLPSALSHLRCAFPARCKGGKGY